VSRTEVDAKIAKINDVNDAIQQKQKEISDLQPASNAILPSADCMDFNLLLQVRNLFLFFAEWRH